MASRAVLPTGCSTRCHCRVTAESWHSDMAQDRVWPPTPPRGPWFSPGQQGSGVSHVRLLQRLAGDT